MSSRKPIVAFCASCTSLALMAGQAPERYYTYASWSAVEYAGLDAEIWTNSLGAVVKAPTDGSAIPVVNDGGKNYEPSWSADCDVHGLEIELPSTESSASGRASWHFNGNYNQMKIGAGGVDVRRGSFSIRRKDANAATLKLTANQTWTGGSLDDKAQLSVGGVQKEVSPYAMLMANAEVDAWAIAGGLNVCLFSPDNRLSGIDVTVRDAAKLHLVDMADAKLSAHRLLLSGPGARMTFGMPVPSRVYAYQWTGKMDYSAAYAPTNVVAVDHAHLAPYVELADGAGFSARGGVYGLTNLYVRGTAASAVSGDLTFTQAVTRVTFLTDGAKLSLETTNAFAGVTSPSLVADGPGTLEVRDARSFTGGFSLLNGAKLVLKEPGMAPMVTGDGTVEVAAGAVVYLSGGRMSGFTGRIVVSGGTLALDGALPEGRLTVTGGEVVYGTDAWVVTDAVRPQETLTVGEGQTLRVFGNGLTAATALVLNAGKLRFECSATVASPVTIARDTATIETADECVVGEIAGFVNSAIDARGRESNPYIVGTAVRGPGCLKLSGGGEWNNYRPNTFYSYDGTVWFANGNYRFRNANCGMQCAAKNTGPYGRKWLVTGEGTRLQVVGATATYAAELHVCGLENQWVNTIESVLEVRDGGEVEVGAYGAVILGYLQSAGRLKIGNGGRVRVIDSSGLVKLGNSTVATGIVELESGSLLETAAPLVHGIQTANQAYQTQGRVVWNGGTIKLHANFPASEASLIRNHKRANEGWTDVNGSLRTWVKVMGDDCVLDLSDLPARETPLQNVPAGLERSEWFGTGTLTVTGGKPFAMQSFPNGIALRLAGVGTRVILPSGVEIHDYATRCATETVAAGKLEYETLKDRLPNLSLAEFVSAGRGVVLENDDTSCAVSIGTVRVPSGGEFVNAGTLVSPTALAVTDLVFLEDAILGDAGGNATFEVLGDITLPSASMRYEAFAAPGAAAYRAQGSIVGLPADWTKEGRKNRRVVVDAAAKEIRLEAFGFLLRIR